jgi:hypothetical protein
MSHPHNLGSRVITALACLLVLFALLAPNRVGDLTPWAFLRIPIEALLAVALLLMLPARAQRVAAIVVGVVLGLLAILKIADLGFHAVLDRPFNPVLDRSYFGSAVDFLTQSIGPLGAITTVVVTVAVVVAVPIFMTLSVQRVTKRALRHRIAVARTVVVLGVVWVVCAVFGIQVAPGLPVAASGASSLAYDRAVQLSRSLHDAEAFAAESAVDAFRDTPADQLLTALRGKDVVLAFVESYGRDAVEDPEFAQVGALLEDGARRLDAAGFASRSAFLTSPTAGGGSWLAHATLLSGLWIDNQERYRTLLAGKRQTITGAFRRAGWRTVCFMPATTGDWPEGAFFGYDRIYDGRNLDYRGPGFGFGTMPDQYLLSAFERLERIRAPRAPLLAQFVLVSSHGPWTPVPRLADWAAVGDGSGLHADGDPPEAVWRDPAQVRTQYGRAIEYSLTTLISYVQTYGDDNLVLVILGDHQPAPIVTGEDASRDVPITIVARDRAVLDRISGWGWQDGLRPGPQAPVWRMNAFRDHFLTAFSQ